MILPGKSGSEQLLQTLRSAGYEADAAASPPEVMEAVQNIGVDLLLLDANVTDLDCCQVLSDVKGSAATAAIRVILLSDGGPGERSRGLDLGADDVLSRSVTKQQDLVAQARKMRDDVLRSGGSPEEKQRLEKQSQELRAKLAGSDSGDVAALREQLAATNTRLRHIEQEGRIAEGIIRTYTKSVCILYVAVAFRDKQSGQRLRDAGTNRH